MNTMYDPVEHVPIMAYMPSVRTLHCPSVCVRYKASPSNQVSFLPSRRKKEKEKAIVSGPFLEFPPSTHKHTLTKDMRGHPGGGGKRPPHIATHDRDDVSVRARKLIVLCRSPLSVYVHVLLHVYFDVVGRCMSTKIFALDKRPNYRNVNS